MMDLFSSFNPITSIYLSLNWLMLMTPILFYHNPLWMMKNKIPMMISTAINNITKQFKMSLTKIYYPNLIMIMSTMIIIMMYNISSLIPNTFSLTSHISINLSMSLTLWCSLMKKKIYNMHKLMSNLTPSNTPTLLIPFMVMIELVSLMIQPITLAIRLTANITAGHIMMILISHMYYMSIIPTLMMNMSMMILELGVSFIQAYVFSMLIIMYNK